MHSITHTPARFQHQNEDFVVYHETELVHNILCQGCFKSTLTVHNTLGCTAHRNFPYSSSGTGGQCQSKTMSSLNKLVCLCFEAAVVLQALFYTAAVSQSCTCVFLHVVSQDSCSQSSTPPSVLDSVRFDSCTLLV